MTSKIKKVHNLPTPYQEYIHMSRYSRWRDDLGRRETWDETVERYFNFFHEHLQQHGTPKARAMFKKERSRLTDAVRHLEVMPSMRAMMTAGRALHDHHVSGYNCSYVAVDHPRVFDETMYVLMCGTGVGFSVEREYVKKLPLIAEEMHETDSTIVVKDSKIGWAAGYKELISLLYQGQIPKWDVSRLRGAGERLKTFGGRASGPAPLVDLFEFTVGVFKNAAGRRLTTLEVHDLMCKIGDVVVVGGVRRSALISLSNLTDERLRHAKSGQWWVDNGQRKLANNSVAYTEKPDMAVFLREWQSLYDSKSGERGIFNRQSAQKQAAKNERREADHDFGTNPCSEIILRSKQFCNLTEVIVRPEDNHDSLKEKVEIATILGTLQSTLVDFKYLTRKWSYNTEEERLLGVSMTGIMDHKYLSGKSAELAEDLRSLRDTAIHTNGAWSVALNIPQSTAITCVKPSGTVSQLVDSASGIHPRYSEYYIRRVRTDRKDPLCQFLLDEGFDGEEDVTSSDVMVFSFPVKAPDDVVMRDDMTAIEQLEMWKLYQDNWCEHKPSITVYYRDAEFLDVGAWVYNNFDSVSGVSFLPHSDHTYRQAPYEEVNKEQYEALLEANPKEIDWAKFALYENTDNTTNTNELSCTGNACELTI